MLEQSLIDQDIMQGQGKVNNSLQHRQPSRGSTEWNLGRLRSFTPTTVITTYDHYRNKDGLTSIESKTEQMKSHSKIERH